MNLNNYVTLEQAKKMKELGFEQDKTDCVWISFYNSQPDFEGWNNLHLETRERLEEIIRITDKVEWYAAPNAQEIELEYNMPTNLYEDGRLTSTVNIRGNEVFRGQVVEAQARADAWIWEREKQL